MEPVIVIKIITWFLMYSPVTVFTLNFQNFPQDVSIVEEGKRQYELIHENSKLPKFGTCWTNAVQFLKLGCKFLNEDVQGDLALKFTDCFLQTSGLEPLDCFNNNKECVKNLNDRTFNAYTEFFTHTQSICYFLQNQIWHEEAEKTIERLTSTSSEVSLLLGESMLVQQKLLQNGNNLSATLMLSRNQILELIDEFRVSTNEQKQVLFEVFQHISSLKSWAIGEISWLDSLFFYFVSMVLVFLFTCTSRTQEARAYIFFVLTLNIMAERYVCNYLIENPSNLPNGSVETAENTAENLNYWIWFSRKLTLYICALIAVYKIYTYCDYDAQNHKLLHAIKLQNHEIIKHFKTLCSQDEHNDSKPQSNLKYSEKENSVSKTPEKFINLISPSVHVHGQAHQPEPFSRVDGVFESADRPSKNRECRFLSNDLYFKNCGAEIKPENETSPTKPSSVASNNSFTLRRSRRLMPEKNVSLV